MSRGVDSGTELHMTRTKCINFIMWFTGMRVFFLLNENQRLNEFSWPIKSALSRPKFEFDSLPMSVVQSKAFEYKKRKSFFCARKLLK